MKIVILGTGGRLGAALIREYADKFDVTGFNRAQLDLSRSDDIRAKLGAVNFDVLINAAGFTNVDACETERDRAFLINGEAPGVLAQICNAKHAKLIHFSTDYVFDGRNARRTQKRIKLIRSAFMANQSWREKRTCMQLKTATSLREYPGCLVLIGRVSSTRTS